MFLVGPKVFNFVVKGSKSYVEGFNGVGVTIESFGKVEISYINVDNFKMNNNRDIQFDIVIGHHQSSNYAFSKF